MLKHWLSTFSHQRNKTISSTSKGFYTAVAKKAITVLLILLLFMFCVYYTHLIWKEYLCKQEFPVLANLLSNKKKRMKRIQNGTISFLAFKNHHAWHILLWKWNIQNDISCIWFAFILKLYFQIRHEDSISTSAIRKTA